ncbi:hypothetical protein AB4Y45_33290 [Paraburkholderia sp. EG287A]|uniref:hypothetical protein n=1 Tax=Paraburkholderia sp. EG287A TaxID=3237012 RepID=UPI0034D244EB
MNNKLKRFIAGVTLVSLTVGQTVSAATSPSLCDNSGYTLGFFNGVWNTVKGASDGLTALQMAAPSTVNGKAVNGELFYNHTGCDKFKGVGCLQDIAETFVQRANELDSSGALASHFEYFWELVAGQGELSVIDRIVALFSTAQDTFTSIRNSLMQAIATDTSLLLSSPPTEADYAAHNARLDALATEGQMLMLVAHSQGNLFVNHAYDHVMPEVGTSSVKVFHIAPASPTLRGEYTLANIDLVINALRAEGGNTVVPVNLTIPTSSADLSGHTLVGTYLDPSRAGRQAVIDGVTAALNQLSPPPQASNIAQGSFTVTMTWSGTGDEDLHVYEPGGSHVYFASRQGQVGYLDTDNTVGYGPEHYYATCDANVLQPGAYQLGLVDYRAADNETATIQVATKDGVILTKQFATGPATMGTSATPVMTVNVAKDSSTGQFSFSAQ